MSIHQSLGSRTLRWRAVRGARPGWELTDGDRTLAVAQVGSVEVEDRLYRTEPQKGRTVLRDVGSGAIVASIRELSSGPATMNVGAGRYRLTRQGVIPGPWEVTEDLGGPQVLDILRLGPVLRIRAGKAIEDAAPAEVELLAILVGMRMLGLLHAEVAAA